VCVGLALLATSEVSNAQVSEDVEAASATEETVAEAIAEQPPITAYPTGASSPTEPAPPGPPAEAPVDIRPRRSLRQQLHMATDTGLPTLAPQVEEGKHRDSVAAGSESLAGFNRDEGAFLRSSDNLFSLRIGALLQTRLSVSTTSDPSRKFEAVPIFGRFYLQGNVGDPWLRYFVQTEFVGQQSPYPVAPVAPAPRLLDAWVEVQPVAWFGLRLGAMRPVFTRSWIVGIQKALLFDRTEANAFFRTHGPLLQASEPGTQLTIPWDRDIGVQVSGAPFGGILEYAVGAFNGNGFMLGRNADSGVMPVARLAINPLGQVAYEETTAAAANPDSSPGIQLGVAAYQNRYNVEFFNLGNTLLGSEEQKTLGADLTVYGATVHFSAEAYLRSRRTVVGVRHQERGLMATLGWMFFSPYLEMATRMSLVDPRVGTARDIRRVYDVELNYYHLGNNAKLGLRYSLANNQSASPGGAPGSLFVVPANETIHTVSLLTQLYF
jgi:hypothetical protein